MFYRNHPIEEKHKSKFDSYLGYNHSWWNYYGEYRCAIDDMVTSIEAGNRKIDEISLPLLFMIRHSIELGLKANILRLQEITKKIDKISFNRSEAHSIDFLYSKFMEHLNYIIDHKRIDGEVILQINKYKEEFVLLETKLHDLDAASFNFRYPVDKSGKSNFEWLARENIFDLINQYYAIQPFILYTENVLTDLGLFES